MIPIAIASGRSIHDGVNIVKSMELNPKTNIYIIGNNGATIYDIYTKKYISQSPIENTTAKKVFEMLKQFVKDENGKMGFIVHQHSSDLLFYNEPFWKPINLKKTGFEDKYDPWIPGRSIYATEYPEDIICYKFVVKFPNHESALKGNEALRKAFPDLEVCLSSDVNVEINKKGINKGWAAETYRGRENPRALFRRPSALGYHETSQRPSPDGWQYLSSQEDNISWLPVRASYPSRGTRG